MSVVPEHVRPAIGIMAAHFQAHIEYSVHAEHMGRVQPYALTAAHLFEFLFNTLLNYNTDTCKFTSGD